MGRSREVSKVRTGTTMGGQEEISIGGVDQIGEKRRSNKGGGVWRTGGDKKRLED